MLEQRVSGLEAYRSWRRLVRGMSERAPGPLELWLPPDPRALAAEPYTAFHDFEIEAGRANTLRRAAARATGLERFATRTPAEATRALDSLPGVGVWTAAMVTGVAHGDPDAVPVGDYGLPGLVGHVLAGERDADDARMLELLEPFAPQRRAAHPPDRALRQPARAPGAACAHPHAPRKLKESETTRLEGTRWLRTRRDPDAGRRGNDGIRPIATLVEGLHAPPDEAKAGARQRRGTRRLVLIRQPQRRSGRTDRYHPHAGTNS